MKTFQHDVPDCAYDTTAGANKTFVTAGANVRGIYLRRAFVVSGGGGSVGFYAGTQILSEFGSGGSEYNTDVIEDMFIPAGVALQANASATGVNKVAAFFKVL